MAGQANKRTQIHVAASSQTDRLPRLLDMALVLAIILLFIAAALVRP